MNVRRFLRHSRGRIDQNQSLGSTDDTQRYTGILLLDENLLAYGVHKMLLLTSPPILHYTPGTLSCCWAVATRRVK